MWEGRLSPLSRMPDILARLEGRLPGELIETLRVQLTEIEHLENRVSELERRIKSLSRDDPGVRAISAIPSAGFLRATAAIAAMESAGGLYSGREFAADSGSGFTLPAW